MTVRYQFLGLLALGSTVATTLPNNTNNTFMTFPASSLRRLGDNWTIAKRAIPDPLCPPGWFCAPDGDCPPDYECPDGRECAVWGGIVVCKYDSQDLCRFSPTERQGLLCFESEHCCHGECYANQDFNCCDNLEVICTDTECDVCSPDQQCATGSTSICRASSTSFSTTTTTTSITESTSTQDSSATTTATTATSTTSTTNVGIPSTTQSSTDPSATASTTTSSTTTTLPPTPTTVPQIDRFSFIGCYVDTADARILVADSSEGENPDGMTVEKCIALAKNGVWRYAGVEFGSQCFVGNTLHGSDQFPDSDCNMICAGNPSELCGDSGRIQVYEDSTWSDPTVEELAEAVRQYSATVEEVRSALADYRRIMADLEEYLSSTSASKVKRDAQLQEFEMEIFQKGNTLKRLQAEEQTKRQITEVRLKRGQALDTTIISKVPGLIIEKWATTGSLAQQLNSVIKILQSNVEVLKEANNQGITPVIDAGAAVAEVDAVLKLIGLNLALGVVGSFFYILGGIIKFFEGGSGDTGPEPTDTTTTKTTTTALSTTTTSTTTSTTTTTCSPTATPTSIGIITKQGTSLSQFNELIASLPQDPDSIQLTNSWQPNFLYVGNMDDCTTDTLSGNPLVEFWTAASDSQPIFYINENGIPECKV